LTIPLSRSELTREVPQYIKELCLNPATKICSVAEAGRRIIMLWIVFGVLLALSLLGLPTSDTAGGFIPVLVLVGVAIVFKKVIQDRRSLAQYWRHKQ
jgi:hypothetical protein